MPHLFSPGGYDGVMRFIDVSSGDIICQVELQRAIYCLKLVRNCILITAGQGNMISLWDTKKFTESREKINGNSSLEAEPSLMMQLDLMKEIYGPVGCSIYALEVISVDINWRQLSKRSRKDDTSQQDLSSINLLLSGGRANILNLWDLETGESVLSIQTPRNVVVHSLAHHLLKQTFQLYSDNKRHSHQQPENSDVKLRQSNDRESVKSLVRIFAGADNGSIYCWNIACYTSRDLVDNADIPQFDQLVMQTTLNCKIDHESSNSHSSIDGVMDANLDCYQGAYHGHNNIVSTLLLLSAPITSSSEEKSDFLDQRSDLLEKNAYECPILVSTSKDIADVRLWHADYLFSSRIQLKEIRNDMSSFICRLNNGHSRAIKTLGFALHQQQKARIFSGMNLFTEISRNDVNVLHRRRDKFYDLLTCGADNKVCVWDVCQIMKDLKWQKIRWFVLLARQIIDLAAHGHDDEDHANHNSTRVSLRNQNLLQNACMAADPKFTNAIEVGKIDLNHENDIAKLKFILIKISYRIDVLSAVGSFLV